jgi:hypothetical protein
MASMDFLTLVQAAYRESGFVGEGPVSVLNQIGRKGDVVRWVLDAHEEIQSERMDWKFDWASGTFALVIGTDTYDPASDFNIVGGVREFIRSPRASYVYPTASGPNGRNFLQFVEWDDFRGMNVPNVPGSTPVTFSKRPDGRIVYYPNPSAACTVYHEYQLAQQVLVAGADVPRMPARFHMAIAWKAVMIGCGKTKDFGRFDTAEEEYEKILNKMLREETPAITIGGSFV